MKPASQMTAAEIKAFKSRPDFQAEYQQFIEYFRMLRPEIDAMYNNKASTEDYYCHVRGALGFDHPSMRDPRAPSLKLIGPYLLEEINISCKKPRVISVNGHLVVPEIIPDLINPDVPAIMGGSKKKRKTMRKRKHRTRRNNRR
jgi:hypothetical protein